MNTPDLCYTIDMDASSTWLTVTPCSQARQNLPYIQGTGEFISHKKFNTRRKNHESYLVDYTIAGKGILEYQGKRYELTNGQFFWIDCHEEQYYYTEQEEGYWQHIWIQFNGGGTGGYYEIFRSNQKGVYVGTLSQNTLLPAYIRSIHSMYRLGNVNLSYDIKAANLINKILDEILVSVIVEENYQNMPETIQAMAAYLSENFMENITLDGLAEKYCMNKYYLLRTFKKHVGFTPNEYLILTRLNRAKDLLRTTELSIGEIAAQVGIENTSYFITQFQKHENCTPGKYRLIWK